MSIMLCFSELRKHNSLGDSCLDLGRCIFNPSLLPPEREKSQLWYIRGFTSSEQSNLKA